MKVFKTETSLILKLEEEKNIFDILESDDLFWNDLYFYESSQDGWCYLYDANRNKVLWLTDYNLNSLEDLLKEREITLIYHENDLSIYDGYEWNIN